MNGHYYLINSYFNGTPLIGQLFLQKEFLLANSVGQIPTTITVVCYGRQCWAWKLSQTSLIEFEKHLHFRFYSFDSSPHDSVLLNHFAQKIWPETLAWPFLLIKMCCREFESKRFQKVLNENLDEKSVTGWHATLSASLFMLFIFFKFPYTPKKIINSSHSKLCYRTAFWALALDASSWSMNSCRMANSISIEMSKIEENSFISSTSKAVNVIQFLGLPNLDR